MSSLNLDTMPRATADPEPPSRNNASKNPIIRRSRSFEQLSDGQFSYLPGSFGVSTTSQNEETDVIDETIKCAAALANPNGVRVTHPNPDHHHDAPDQELTEAQHRRLYKEQTYFTVDQLWDDTETPQLILRTSDSLWESQDNPEDFELPEREEARSLLQQFRGIRNHGTVRISELDRDEVTTRPLLEDVVNQDRLFFQIQGTIPKTTEERAQNTEERDVISSPAPPITLKQQIWLAHKKYLQTRGDIDVHKRLRIENEGPKIWEEHSESLKEIGFRDLKSYKCFLDGVLSFSGDVS